MSDKIKKILVIDDEHRIADIIEKYLKRKGFETYKAYSGQGGLEVLKKVVGVDLIILDEKMPGMSGTSFIKKVNKVGQRIPVIMLTGSIGMLAISKEQKALFEHLLIKPVRLSELLDLINSLI